MNKNIYNQFNETTPGYALGVIKSGNLVFEKYSGLSNLKTKTPIDVNTAFRLASITKQFTAMAIVTLSKQGKLDLNNRIDTFIPDFPLYGKNITIQQLINHTSGIPDHEKPLYKILKSKEEPTIYDSLEVLKTRKRLLFKPGTKYAYSNAGYVLLAIIIEKVSGIRYAEFLQKYIFIPLGMKNTIVLDETKPKIPNRALGYRLNRKKWELYDYDPLNYIVGDEGVYSSLNDLTKWVQSWSQQINNIFWFRKRRYFYQTGSWVGFNNIILTDPKTNTTVIFLSNTTQFPTERERIDVALKILSEYNSTL